MREKKEGEMKEKKDEKFWGVIYTFSTTNASVPVDTPLSVLSRCLDRSVLLTVALGHLSVKSTGRYQRSITRERKTFKQNQLLQTLL